MNEQDRQIHEWAQSANRHSERQLVAADRAAYDELLDAIDALEARRSELAAQYRQMAEDGNPTTGVTAGQMSGIEEALAVLDRITSRHMIATGPSGD